MVQQIFADVFHRANWMPAVFALCALSMGAAAYMNSRLVERLGLRAVSHTALLLFICVTAVHASIPSFGFGPPPTFVLRPSSATAAFALSGSTLRPLAIEPGRA